MHMFRDSASCRWAGDQLQAEEAGIHRTGR
jgi:hypothetical protein